MATRSSTELTPELRTQIAAYAEAEAAKAPLPTPEQFSQLYQALWAPSGAPVDPANVDGHGLT